MVRAEDETLFTREHRQTRSIAELRVENKLLRRKVARLEKALRRYRGEDIEGPDEDEEALAPVPALSVEPARVCPECESTHVATFQTPKRLLIVCKDCHHRF